MDSERFFFLDGELDDVRFQELAPDELASVEHHVEIVQHLQEIDQLYRMVLCNLRMMRDNYEWMSSGEVRYQGRPAEADEHFIAVNTLIVNLIGSARTLTESMECYLRENYAKESETRQSYFDVSHQIYDQCFAYRLLIRLRDFSQHGHPPVSRTGANYCFDLRQILGMPRFAHNKQIKEQLETAVREIMEKYRGQPTLGVTLTVAEFTVGLFQLYNHFLGCVKEHLRDSLTRLREVQNKHPENVIQRDGFWGQFLYKLEDANAHTISVDDDAITMLEGFQADAKDTLTVFQSDWDQLKENTIFVSLDGTKKELSVL